MRRIGLQVVCVLLVLFAAVLWETLAGTATARVLRRGFGVLDPVLVLEVAAALLVVGVGSRVLPAGQRVTSIIRIDLLDARPGRGRLRVATVVVLSAIVALAAVFRVALDTANHTPKVLGDELIYSGLAKGWAVHGEPLLRGSLDVARAAYTRCSWLRRSPWRRMERERSPWSRRSTRS